MAASILNSPRAIEMSVFVVRAFVQLRDLAAVHGKIAARLDDLETHVSGHDTKLKTIIGALRGLIDTPTRQRRRIGF